MNVLYDQAAWARAIRGARAALIGCAVVLAGSTAIVISFWGGPRGYVVLPQLLLITVVALGLIPSVLSGRRRLLAQSGGRPDTGVTIGPDGVALTAVTVDWSTVTQVTVLNQRAVTAGRRRPGGGIHGLAHRWTAALGDGSEQVVFTIDDAAALRRRVPKPVRHLIGYAPGGRGVLTLQLHPFTEEGRDLIYDSVALECNSRGIPVLGARSLWELLALTRR